MLLVFQDPAQRSGRTPDEARAAYVAMRDWAAELQAAGRLLAVDSRALLLERAAVPVAADGHAACG